MRVIRSNDAKTVAGEMLNFELGKKMFANGKYLEAPHEPYENIYFEGVKTTIKRNFGIIYTHGGFSFDENFATLIDDMMNLIPYELCNRNGYIPLECSDNGFTTMKAKINFSSDTVVETGNYKLSITNFERVIWNRSGGEGRDIFEYIGLNKFTWMIMGFSQLINNITRNATTPTHRDHLLEYFTIIHDVNSYITPSNDEYMEILDNNLKLTDFKFMKVISPITSYGMLSTEKIIEKLTEYKKQKKKKLTEPNGKIKPDIIDLYLEDQHRSELTFYNFKNIKNPAYVPNLKYITNNILYCNKRLGAFEIIKNLGDANKYKINKHNSYYGSYDLSESLTIVPIDRSVHAVNYNDIIINNTLNMSIKTSDHGHENDKCFYCGTPLYGDVYGIFPENNNECVAVCPICMHTNWDIKNSKLPYYGMRKNDVGTIYSTSLNSIIAKFQYPRSVDQVIDMINMDDHYKDIIRSMYNPNNYKWTSNNVIYFNYPYEGKPIYVGTNYIGQYMSEWFQKPRKVFNNMSNDDLKKLWDRSVIVPMIII